MSLIKEYFTQEETEAKNYVCNLCQKTFVAPATGTHVHNASRQHIGPHGTPARCTLQFVRRCYGLRGIYGRFDSKILFEIDSIRDSIRTQKNDSQLPIFNQRRSSRKSQREELGTA